MRFATAQTVDTLLPLTLRDTASIVVALRSGNLPSVEHLRKQCDDLAVNLRKELQRRGLSHDVIDDALYAQCALLDEAALMCLRDDARDVWEREPLQVRTFGRNDAGEELLRRIGRRLREATPVLPLLQIFAAVLRLGFAGRFAANEQVAREKLVSEIDERLTRAVGNGRDGDAHGSAGAIVVNPSRRRRRPLPPLSWVLIAWIAAGLVWFAIDQWLMSAISGMGS